MKYRNIVIKCKKDKVSDLQKHLFRLKYSWVDGGLFHRHIKSFDYDICIIIRNDRSIHFLPTKITSDSDFRKKGFDVVTYPKFLRKEKLLKLKND